MCRSEKIGSFVHFKTDFGAELFRKPGVVPRSYACPPRMWMVAGDSLPSADSRRAVVSYWQKYMH